MKHLKPVSQASAVEKAVAPEVKLTILIQILEAWQATITKPSNT